MEVGRVVYSLFNREKSMKGDVMKYKHIEASREARLWITQIVVPSMILAASVLQIPEVKLAVNEKIASFRNRKK